MREILARVVARARSLHGSLFALDTRENFRTRRHCLLWQAVDAFGRIAALFDVEFQGLCPAIRAAYRQFGLRRCVARESEHERAVGTDAQRVAVEFELRPRWRVADYELALLQML